MNKYFSLWRWSYVEWGLFAVGMVAFTVHAFLHLVTPGYTLWFMLLTLVSLSSITFLVLQIIVRHWLTKSVLAFKDFGDAISLPKPIAFASSGLIVTPMMVDFLADLVQEGNFLHDSVEKPIRQFSVIRSGAFLPITFIVFRPRNVQYPLWERIVMVLAGVRRHHLREVVYDTDAVYMKNRIIHELAHVALKETYPHWSVSQQHSFMCDAGVL